MPRDTNSRLVYSTEHGSLRAEGGGRAKASPPPKSDGIVRIWRQTKGRKGKGVSCVTGLPLALEALEALARQLKQRCGAGGTVKDGAIEIQGDHRELLALALRELGYTVKLAGG
jgi:translation initiation factor 1